MTTNIGGIEYLSSTEAAKLLGVNPGAMQVRRSRARATGKQHAPYIMAGARSCLYPVSDFREYLRRGGR